MRFSMHHACISVTDLERSVEFYREALGLKVMKRINDSDGEFNLAYLGSDGAKCRLELIWNRDKDGPYNLGDNESHIGFDTDDYEASLELHKRINCFDHENKKYKLYFITDPDGYLIEISG